jgi:hypothetical protein
MTFVIFNAIDGKIFRGSPSLILLLGDGLPDGHCIGDADRQEVLCSDGVWRGAAVPMWDARQSAAAKYDGVPLL